MLRHRIRWIAVVGLAALVLPGAPVPPAAAAPSPCSGNPPSIYVCHQPACSADGWHEGPPLAAGTSCSTTGIECGSCNSSGTCVAQKCPPTGSGSAKSPAKYAVLSVVYSPPGSAAKGASSFVAYTSTSTTGVSVSSSSSFKQGWSVSASASGGGASASAGFSVSQQSGTSNEVDLQTSTIAGQKFFGPAEDGIDHTKDEVLLWLNPGVEVSVSGPNVAWSPYVNGSTAIVATVYASQLANPSTLPPGTQAAFNKAGITQSDITTILGLDPFVTASPAIDPRRFWLTNETIPYEPPDAPTDVPNQFNLTIDNTLTNKSTSTWTNSYDVSLTSGGGFDVGVVKASLSSTSSWTWTQTNALGASNSSQQQQTVTISGPSYGYKGSTLVDVYYDSVYGTFFFAFDPFSSPSSTGALATVTGTLSIQGAPAAGQAVQLSVGGQTFRTYTSVNGRYSFYKTPTGSGTLTIRGAQHPVRVSPGTARQDVKL